jgi:hypothetical protein
VGCSKHAYFLREEEGEKGKKREEGASWLGQRKLAARREWKWAAQGVGMREREKEACVRNFFRG